MDYVMVPVPEELAPKVLRYISWRGHPLLERRTTDGGDGGDGSPAGEADGRDGSGGGDPTTRVFGRLDAPSRTLLGVVAAAAVGQRRLTVAEAAQQAGLSEREVIGVITEVNNLVAGEGGPPVTLLVSGMEGAEDAPFSWERRVVLMAEPVARAIADLAPAPAE